MLSNLTIKKKLFFLALIACIAILLLVLNTSYIKYQEYHANKNLEKLVIVSTNISGLVHEVQKERGMSVGYLNSNGINFKNELPSQYKLTDEKIENLKALLVSDSVYDVIDKEHFFKFFDAVVAKRGQIMQNKVATTDAIGFYTGSIKEFLESINAIARTSQNNEISKTLNTYANFLQAKERTGIERAVGTGAAAANSFTPDTYNKYISLIAAQECFLQTSIASANEYQKTFLKNLQTDETFAKVQDIRQILQSKSNEGNFGLEASEVFKTYTTKIERLKNAEDFLSNNALEMIRSIIDASLVSLVTFFVLGGAIGLFVLVFASLISKNIVASLMRLEQGILLLIGERRQSNATRANDRRKKQLVNYNQNASKVEIDSKDEVGDIARLFNEYLDVIQKGLAKDEVLIAEITQVMNAVSSGYFDKKLTQDGANEGLIEVKKIINTMLDEFQTTIHAILLIVNSYSNDDLRDSIQLYHLQGDMKELIDGINKLGDVLRLNAKTALQHGEELLHDSKTLTGIVHQLMTMSSDQAASLEETASAMEEISATIANNTQKALMMTKLAKESEYATKHGLELTQKSSLVMNEIKQMATLISDSIGVIDSIAFQTNILSLNAAVEAATAGEAGKGFAVVAGEVRNLATKSAEASADIRQITQKAMHKANEGDEVVSEVSVGFEDIFSKSQSTTVMIEEVSNANQEQLLGVNQVTASLSQIERAMQGSLHTVDEVSKISDGVANMANLLVSQAKNVKL